MSIRRAVATALARLAPCAPGDLCDRPPTGRRAGTHDPKTSTAVGKEKQ
ncbi:hypothetical protein [Streptomyces sp. UNOB3_S3]|nr:hypothetical protein [Streptomyces sp. UNOB3_S3]MCC3774931.1 hypothetical protein [Streptomyces sp. UNOB3_S3]